MKRLLFCLGFFGLILVKPAGATEVAVVNLDEVIKNSTAMTKVNRDLEAKKGEMEKKLKADEKKLNDEKNTLESQIKTLSQEVAQEKVMAFQQKVIDFQKNVRENENQLQKSYVEAVMEITETIKTVIADMKNEKNSKYDYEVAIPTASVLYSEKSLDISSEVLSRLNKKLKEVKVSVKKQ